MSDVFISHVEEDAGIALEIALGLEEAGYTTWCYEVDNIPGPSYLLQTGQAVEQAKALVLVISPHSLGSRQVTKEVIRAHETGGEFIPVLRDITHIEFQNRQPEWREALGAASSIRIPMEGVTDIIPRIISGLKASGVLPETKPEAAHIAQIRKTLGELQGYRVLEKTKEQSATAMRTKLEAATAETLPVKTTGGSGWRKKWVRLALIAFVVITASVVGIILLSQPEPPLPASGTKPVTLKYETFLPNTDRLVMVDTWFLNEVSRLSDGLIEIEYHYGVPHSATMSPLLKAVGDGDIDCGLIPPVAIPHLIPLSQGLSFHYLTHKPDTLLMALDSLYNTFTPLREEWEVTNNVHVYLALPLDTLVLCTTSPVSGVDDLKGLKICGTGRTADTLERLGAEPIVVPTADIYEALNRGLVDGTLSTFEDIARYKYFKVAKYLTEPWAGPEGMFVTVINKDVWDGLPANIIDLMDSLVWDAIAHHLETMMEYNREIITKEMVTAGVSFSIWPGSERDIAKNRVQPAQAQDWIEETGTNGQKLIDRLQEELAIYEARSTYKSGFEMWQEVTDTPTPTPAREGTKQINIIYVEGNNRVLAKEIWLSYYDEDALAWISEKGLTDKEGMATFRVPEGESGESFTFAFAFSEAEVNERVQEIKAGTRMGWRIPPNPLQTSLTLETDNDFHVSVVDGSFQMWVP